MAQIRKALEAVIAHLDRNPVDRFGHGQEIFRLRKTIAGLVEAMDGDAGVFVPDVALSLHAQGEDALHPWVDTLCREIDRLEKVGAS